MTKKTDTVLVLSKIIIWKCIDFVCDFHSLLSFLKKSVILNKNNASYSDKISTAVKHKTFKFLKP